MWRCIRSEPNVPIMSASPITCRSMHLMLGGDCPGEPRGDRPALGTHQGMGMPQTLLWMYMRVCECHAQRARTHCCALSDCLTGLQAPTCTQVCPPTRRVPEAPMAEAALRPQFCLPSTHGPLLPRKVEAQAVLARAALRQTDRPTPQT